MNYTASITDFFKSPKWGMNLLLAAICFIIPAIGPIVLQGWHITGFWAQRDERDPAKFPAFDFQYFGKYLERGIWPFLVSLVATFAFMAAMVVLIVLPLILSGLLVTHSENGTHNEFSIVMMVSMFVIYPIALLIFYLIMTPLMLRASITQDFVQSFNLGFMKSFVSLMLMELIVTTLFMIGVGIVVMILTVVTCYIGGLFSFPVFLYGWHHLQKQLYLLYLSRGGEPVPVSRKLADLPPVLPL
ncbi:MAG: DUF4013 domain-containing protein [Luteolibacter sp.]